MNHVVIGVNNGGDFVYGAPGRTRTGDLRFRKPLLYPLSYRGAKAWHASKARESFGGDSGARTRNLGIANAALSQLSYIPT